MPLNLEAVDKLIGLSFSSALKLNISQLLDNRVLFSISTAFMNIFTEHRNGDSPGGGDERMQIIPQSPPGSSGPQLTPV